ncbi:PEP-CTERM sorting domain-containing protein [Paludisphaera sp.]|uniref:PEP-CTERM sorting domain-containing protein n=1 Tax=Paludisphaera sp. TaxID=2017432 RepID=UPI00301BB25A
MRPLYWVALLAAGVATSWGDRAEASPLRLRIEGSGGLFAPGVEATLAAGGDAPLLRVAESTLSELHPSPLPPLGTGAQLPFSTPFAYRAVLEDSGTGARLAELTLAGVAEGIQKYWLRYTPPYVERMELSAAGEAVASDLRLAEGVLSDQIPPWFPNLSARLAIGNDPAGPTGFEVESVLTIAAPVPEPGSVFVFLGVVGSALVARRRRRRMAA